MYPEFLNQLQTQRQKSRDFVEQTEARLAAGETLVELLTDPPPKPFQARTWLAFVLNVKKLVGVKRIRGGPYSTHPTRMALIADAYIEEPEEKELTMIYALFHDYLEEGDGLTVRSLSTFREAFPQMPSAHMAAVLLSEPMLPKGRFTKINHRTLLMLSYVIQLEALREFFQPRTFYTTSLLDKIDNLHDLDYIIANPKLTEDKRRKRILEKLAYFAMVGERIGVDAHPALRQILMEAVRARAKEFRIEWGAVHSEIDRLDRLGQQITEEMKPLISQYHEKIGLILPYS